MFRFAIFTTIFIFFAFVVANNPQSLQSKIAELKALENDLPQHYKSVKNNKEMGKAILELCHVIELRKAINEADPGRQLQEDPDQAKMEKIAAELAQVLYLKQELERDLNMLPQRRFRGIAGDHRRLRQMIFGKIFGFLGGILGSIFRF